MGLSRSSAVAMVMAATFIWGLAMKPMSEAANDCGSLLVSLSGCQTFLKDPSSTPDQKGCCQPLQTVLSSSGGIQCICALDTGAGTQSAQYKNALRIPDACKLGVNVSATNCSSITPPSTGTPSSPKSSSPGASVGGFLVVVGAVLCSGLFLSL